MKRYGIGRHCIPVDFIQWRHNERIVISNHQPHDCLFDCLFKAQIKENIKAPRHWPLCGEFTIDRWIPRTKGQLHGKYFHLMTSSCTGLALGMLVMVVMVICDDATPCRIPWPLPNLYNAFEQNFPDTHTSQHLPLPLIHTLLGQNELIKKWIDQHNSAFSGDYSNQRQSPFIQSCWVDEMRGARGLFH